MWKRLNNPRGTRPPVNDSGSIDNFIEDPYGNSGPANMNRNPGRQDMGGPTQSTVSRPLQDNLTPRGLPHLPFEPVQPPSAHQNRESVFRPASSIYSQPSPNPITTRFPREQYTSPNTYTEDAEVSPPSSPEFGVVSKQRSQHQEDQEVSPIDEMPDVSHLDLGGQNDRPGSSSRPPTSNIPILRREKRRNQVAPQVSAGAPVVGRKEIGEAPKGRKTIDPRWDPYSGEITTSDRGKPQSVKPGTFTPPGLRPVHAPTGTILGNVSSITGGTKAHTSFSDRVRKLKNKNEVPAERPEWKGATRTGRVTLVSPVADQYDLPPLSMPQRGENRIASPQSDSHSGSPTPVTIIRSRDDETSLPSPVSAHGNILNRGKNSPLQSSKNVTADPVAVIPSVTAKTMARGNTFPVEAPSTTTLERNISTTSIERNFREALNDVSFPNESSDPYVQPPSRFSVTTYAPSEAQTTPRPSTDTLDRPAMPTPPQKLDAAQQSILNRQRPKVAESLKHSISRKAINPGSPVFISMSSSVVSKRSSNTTKNLPMSPAEAQSHDLVTSLQAQLDDLAHRRNNITRSIRQMTELMPKDSVILTDDVRRKREGEKIKVEALRVEEADIRREEHDIGLRLHRAWKRRDKDAIYEPTGLWVRRVTG